MAPLFAWNDSTSKDTWPWEKRNSISTGKRHSGSGTKCGQPRVENFPFGFLSSKQGREMLPQGHPKSLVMDITQFYGVSEVPALPKSQLEQD